MTEIRGRVLIINNRHALGELGEREGSEYDYDNIERMFRKFGFIISGFSSGRDRDWTAQVLNIDIPVISLECFVASNRCSTCAAF